MATLTSPGVDVSVIDESFYVPADAGTTPLFIVTSAQDKKAGSGTTTAVGTQSTNAGTVYLVTSQRELTETFGDPKFYTDASGNPLNGYELNEYGLQAAYSFLGVANRAYVLRSNLDVSNLTGSAIAPTSNPTDGTYWLDLASSKFGIFEWSSTDQAFTTKTPTLITSVSQLAGNVSTGAPKQSVGSIGDYAINTTHVTNKIYFKNDANAWVHLGSTAWHISHPTITSSKTNSGTSVTSGHSITINGTSVSSSATTLTNVAARINAASITGVTAAIDSTTGFLEIYSDGTSASDGSTVDGKITIANASGTLMTDAGLTAGTYAAPQFLQAPHTSRPEWKSADTTPRPNGSVWFKTTSPNSGTDIKVKLYSSSTASFSSVSSNMYANNHSAIYNLDTTGGSAISVGTLYAQYNVTEQGGLDATPNVGDFQIFRYEGGQTVISSKSTFPSFTHNETFSIQESVKNSSTLASAKTVTVKSLDGSTAADNEDFVAAVNGAGLTNVVAEVITTGVYAGAIKMTHKLGGDFRMVDTSGTPLADAGFSNSTAHSYGTYTANSSTLIDNLYDAPTGEAMDSSANNAVVATNWKRLSYTASTTTPSNEAADGTLWYNTNLEADIMVHNGTTWKGYVEVYSSTDPNGPQFSASAPTTQSDGSALVDEDLWIDTSDLENFPKLYKYNTSATISNSTSGVAVTTTGAAWELVDNADQTTENGVVFADARYHTAADRFDSAGTGGAGTPSSIKDLLSDSFLDPDAPNPALYPKSILLWNTRRSGYNVKEYKNTYISTTKYPGSGSTGLGNLRYNNESVSSYYADRWVTKSANNADGSGSFGRKAQRKVITAQIKSEIDTNQAIREDQRGFNVIAAPGYPEAIANMLNLNADRNYTAFVVGDTPFRLDGNATAVSNWSNNTASADDNGEDGLVSNSEYLGVFYPSGKSTDNSGNSIVVPPSHMMMRVLANNDNVAFPWFAPAGTRRGIVDNSTAVGYIKADTGEFESISVTEGMRDAMHTAKVNPITFFSGAGIMNFGNLTKVASSYTSALDRINVSRLTVYLRSQLESIAKPFIFEPNDTLTRNEIKGAIESFLLELAGQRALYDFLVVCDETNNTATRIDRNELYVDIAIEPVKSVEFIYIPLRIKNTGEIAKLGN
jgi:hypothetical protein